MRFVIRSRRWPVRRWWWTLVATNGEPLAHSEQYTSKAACRATVDVVIRDVYDAHVVDLT